VASSSENFGSKNATSKPAYNVLKYRIVGLSACFTNTEIIIDYAGSIVTRSVVTQVEVPLFINK